MGGVITAYLHYVGVMVLFSALLAEHLLFKKNLDSVQASRLSRIDMVYGISAVVVLITGLLRFLVFEKGSDFYLDNALFYIKVSLFLFAGILSIYPTMYFLSWRKVLVRDQAPVITSNKFRSVMMLIRVQLAIIMALPLFAVMMARGIGYIG